MLILYALSLKLWFKSVRKQPLKTLKSKTEKFKSRWYSHSFNELVILCLKTAHIFKTYLKLRNSRSQAKQKKEQIIKIKLNLKKHI